MLFNAEKYYPHDHPAHQTDGLMAVGQQQKAQLSARIRLRVA